MKILIADDEEVVRASLDGILKSIKTNVIDFAMDGEEAVKKAKEKLYDLILLDLEMPKLNGYEVLTQVRALYPDLPVIFVTGTGEARKIMKSIAQDKLNAFIEKPFTPEKVLEVVTKALGMKKIDISLLKDSF